MRQLRPSQKMPTTSHLETAPSPPRLQTFMKCFLGVDQSLTGMGLVVLSEAGVILLQRVVRPAALRGVDRLAHLRAALRTVLDEYRPAHAALEGYAYGATGRVFQLGELGGVVQLAFFDADVPFLTVTPAALKKYVTNNHQADKALMLRKTNEKWGVDFGKEDDICDAHGLAHILKAIARNDTTVRHELEVINELTAPVKVPEKAVRTAKSRVRVSI